MRRVIEKRGREKGRKERKKAKRLVVVRIFRSQVRRKVKRLRLKSPTNFLLPI